MARRRIKMMVRMLMIRIAKMVVKRMEWWWHCGAMKYKAVNSHHDEKDNDDKNDANDSEEDEDGDKEWQLLALGT